jgi:DNA repair exonuclease SbcCD nuclease subunit
MPKFLHTADLHLNALRRFSHFYLDRARGCLGSIYQIARRNKVDFIVVAGDVYDRRDITHAERLLLSEWLSMCDIPVIMVSGNHDKRSTEFGDTCLTYLSAFAHRLGEHFVHDGLPLVYKKFGCYLILLPYQGWMDQELFLIVDALLEQCSDKSLPVVVVAHEAVHGCQTDVGFSVTKNNQVRLDSSFPRVAYWALGDMHMCQQILPNAWYSGSPHQTRFDETVEKGVLIVDTERADDPEFVSVPSIPLRILNEEPDEWPDPEEALIQYRPSGPFPERSLPLNVEFHPSVVALERLHEKNQAVSLIGVFDGLDNALLRTKLTEDLFPLAWRIAIKLAKTAGVEVPLPERYQDQNG